MPTPILSHLYLAHCMGYNSAISVGPSSDFNRNYRMSGNWDHPSHHTSMLHRVSSKSVFRYISCSMIECKFSSVTPHPEGRYVSLEPIEWFSCRIQWGERRYIGLWVSEVSCWNLEILPMAEVWGQSPQKLNEFQFFKLNFCFKYDIRLLKEKRK
jgi:hypothetical protein